MVDFNAEWYDRLLDNTNEKTVLVNKIKSLLEGKSHESCLEIGLGTSPYFAKNLLGLFKRYVIVERQVVDISLPKGVELVNKDWEAVDLMEKFDVIIASHVIYYFKDKKKALEKIFASLNKGGRVYFVVNGKEADYGPLKRAFSEIICKKYLFTYDELMALIKSKKFREYTVPSSIHFKSYEDLFETLRISFDHYPKEYQVAKSQMIEYFRGAVGGRAFNVDQKIIEVFLD